MRQTGEGKNQASAELAVLRRFRPNGTESCGIRSIDKTIYIPKTYTHSLPIRNGVKSLWVRFLYVFS